MEHTILNQELQRYRSQIEDKIKALHDMTQQIGNDSLSNTVSELRNRISEPFLFVIVGEVKVGKSSFINALLETQKEVCKVAPDPCTDTIQQIIYGETEETIVVNPNLKKIFYPVNILKEIAIVDTPGTNTISAYHQEITEGFVPGSDLVVFVFEAKNPYRQSAWEFFDFIHQEWRKKIIFVLQQADLMNADDLKINEEGVKKQALQKGINDPQIFSVSAKLELEGQSDTSGFPRLRDYIKANITGGQAPILKLQNNTETALQISKRIRAGLELREQQLRSDQQFRSEVTHSLDQQEARSGKQVDLLVENLIAGYDRTTLYTERELQRGLSFWTLAKRSFLSVFTKQVSITDWLEELAKNLESNLKTDLQNRLQDGVHGLAEQVQLMAKMIDLKLRSSETILNNNHEIFGDIADRRSNVLRDLQLQFSEFINKGENFLAPELFAKGNQVSPQIATGSGIAVIGVLLTTLTQGVVFDITGGILTAVGIVFAGASASIKRKKIINDYRQEIDKGRKALHTKLDEKLKSYIKHLKEKIDANFHDFDDLLASETTQVNELSDKHQHIYTGLLQMKEDLNPKI
ncbi:MAG: dynamin family protein [Bacteroidota bacterium]